MRTSAPSKRIVSAIVADGGVGQIRSSSDVVGIGGGVTLNVDTNPELLADGKIKLGFSLVYDWPAPVNAERSPERGTVIKTSMHDSVSLILENLAEGVSQAELLKAYPQLKADDIRAALAYGAEATRERVVSLEPVA